MTLNPNERIEEVGHFWPNQTHQNFGTLAEFENQEVGHFSTNQSSRNLKAQPGQ
jgi:hypothetical protein